MTQISKIILGIILIALLTVIAFIVLMKKNVQRTPAAVTPPTTTESSPQAETSAVPAPVPLDAASPVSAETPLLKFEDIQARSEAGTLSPEEKLKALEALKASTQVPAKTK